MSAPAAWVRRHAAVLSVLLVAVVAAGTIAAVVWEARTRESAVAAEQAARLDQVCGSITANRKALLDLTAVVVAGDAPSLPLTSLPEFQALDAPTQDYVKALAESQVAEPGTSTRERITAFRQGLLAAPLPEFCTTP